MITVFVLAMAALFALEAVLGLALLGWGLVEPGAFLRRHPDGAAGGLRELATGARRVWPAAKASSQIAGRRVIAVGSSSWSGVGCRCIWSRRRACPPGWSRLASSQSRRAGHQPTPRRAAGAGSRVRRSVIRAPGSSPDALAIW
ncbi:hypothetical protein [Nonomuraea sp. NPDC049695]|uniref:hypothetical protein n=1 Tax=Nonomuraea sp. NPDC049695 TaxID=3154734 RepID=UPI00342F95F0